MFLPDHSSRPGRKNRKAAPGDWPVPFHEVIFNLRGSHGGVSLCRAVSPAETKRVRASFARFKRSLGEFPAHPTAVAWAADGRPWYTIRVVVLDDAEWLVVYRQTSDPLENCQVIAKTS